jgi:hypothetical protein
VPLQAGHFSSFGFDLMGFMVFLDFYGQRDTAAGRKGFSPPPKTKRPNKTDRELIDRAKHPDQQIPDRNG